MIAILTRAWRNYKHYSRCMMIGSFEVPLLTASTKLRLSHWISVGDWANKGTQMAQLNMMGTSSLVIVLTAFQSVDQAFCGHWWSKSALHLGGQMCLSEYGSCRSMVLHLEGIVNKTDAIPNYDKQIPPLQAWLKDFSQFSDMTKLVKYSSSCVHPHHKGSTWLHHLCGMLK